MALSELGLASKSLLWILKLDGWIAEGADVINIENNRWQKIDYAMDCTFRIVMIIISCYSCAGCDQDVLFSMHVFTYFH